MTIEPTGETLRFRVASESGESPYMVDAAAWFGIGKCECADFQFRREPQLMQLSSADGLTPKQIESYRCKHLRYLSTWLAGQVVDRVRAADAERSRVSGVLKPEPWE